MLPPGVVDAVLLGLGLEGEVPADRGGLERLYGAWCERVPFDNVLKMLCISERWPGPLPGSCGVDFFRDWMEYRTGGTCWAGNGALFELCRTLGFQVERGVATMMSTPDAAGPNHGTVIVALEEGRFVVDASILSGRPLELPGAEAGSAGERGADPALSLPRVVIRAGGLAILWRTMGDPHGFVCRLDRTGVSDAEWEALHQRTAAWSPFNTSLSVRIQRAGRALGFSGGQRFEIEESGALRTEETDRARFLVEELSMDPLVVDRLPPDGPPGPRPEGF
jgi:N-hydroxyarylamine O-acetyltransferase